MNVRGFNQDGEESELRMSSQNESFLEISKRFNRAIEKSPSEETEIELEKIVDEVIPKTRTDYEKMLIFQCQREIARSKIKRQQYEEAIPYLIETLKIDESRTNLWADLAMCAKETQKTDLYRAAQGKVQLIRPELNFYLPKPGLPPIKTVNIEPEFIQFTLKQECFRHFLTALELGNKSTPYSILVVGFDHEMLDINQNERKFALPEHYSQASMPEVVGKSCMKLGGIGLIDFLKRLGAEQISKSAFVFDQSIHMITANAINLMPELKFREAILSEVSVQIINLSSKYVLDLLNPNARLFIAELASVHYPEMVSTFLTDVMHAYIHRPTAILRITFATLEGAIRENKSFGELKRLYEACKCHLKSPQVAIPHAARVINQALLEEKREQIEIMESIDNNRIARTDELAAKYFSQKCPLQFLSLKNVVKLFCQFKDEQVRPHLIHFLKLLQNLIKTNPKDIGILTTLFQRFRYEMEEECVVQLRQIFQHLVDRNVDKNIKFAAALAIAYASAKYPGRSKLLSSIHAKLGDCCYLQGGEFLEKLLESLLAEQTNEFVSETTKAFGCYFSNCAFTNPHGSNLELRCSPFMQPFYNHIRKLEEKGSATQNQLSTPYLLLWMHHRSEMRDDHKKHRPCLTEIDGWSVYRVVKRLKESAIAKTAQLPKDVTTVMLLEEMLREGVQTNPAAEIALTKVVIKQFVAKRQQEVNQRMTSATAPVIDDSASKRIILDAVNTLSKIDDSAPDWQKLIKAVALYYADNTNMESLSIIRTIQPFTDSPKKEARRLYWTMRLHSEAGRSKDPVAVKAASDAISHLEKLPQNIASGSEYCVMLLCAAGSVRNDSSLFKRAIDSYCKSRIVLPQPYVELAKSLEPNDAFKIISKITRSKSMNINNFFHFDFKVPFLMGSPDDLETIRHDLLQVYIDSAVKSGNFTQIFTLINPNNKPDRKLSRVFKENRFVFGIDRTEILIKYIDALAVFYQTSKKKDMEERAIDALCKSVRVLELKHQDKPAVPEKLAKEVLRAQHGLLEITWKKVLNETLPDDATVNDLFNKLNDVIEEEEDDSEEDGDFVDEGDGEGEEEDGEGENGEAQEGEEDGEEENEEGEGDGEEDNDEEEGEDDDEGEKDDEISESTDE